MPLESGQFDCILSNCVINLTSDKNAVFREMYRVLKSGGRVAVSDVIMKKPLPADLQSVASICGMSKYCGCCHVHSMHWRQYYGIRVQVRPGGSWIQECTSH